MKKRNRPTANNLYIAGGDILSREGGRKLFPKNKYYSPEEIKDFKDGEELETLERSGKHFHSVYHAPQNGQSAYLSFPHWEKWCNCDYYGDLNDCCLAPRGKYSIKDGIDDSCNQYTLLEFNPASRLLGHVAYPDNKYFTKAEINALADNTKVDVLIRDLNRLVHFHGIFRSKKRRKRAYVHFPHWGDEFDTIVDVTDICIAPHGKYSRWDGVEERTNNLSGEEKIEYVNVIGDLSPEKCSISSHMQTPTSNASRSFALCKATVNNKARSNAVFTGRKRIREDSQCYSPSDLGPLRVKHNRNKNMRSRVSSTAASSSKKGSTIGRIESKVLLSPQIVPLTPTFDTYVSGSFADSSATASCLDADEPFALCFEEQYFLEDAIAVDACESSYSRETALHGETALFQRLSVISEMHDLVHAVEAEKKALEKLRDTVKRFEENFEIIDKSLAATLSSTVTCRRKTQLFVEKTAGGHARRNTYSQPSSPSTSLAFKQLKAKILLNFVDLQLLINNKVDEVTADENQLFEIRKNLYEGGSVG